MNEKFILNIFAVAPIIVLGYNEGQAENYIDLIINLDIAKSALKFTVANGYIRCSVFYSA